jgi:hypothetical protein
VAEYRRERDRDHAVGRGNVGVTDPDAAHPYEDLALAGLGQLHLLELQRSSHVAKYRCGRRDRGRARRERRLAV